MSGHYFAVRAFLAFVVVLVLATFGQPQGTPDLPLQQWSFSVGSTSCKAVSSCADCPEASSQCNTFQVPSTGSYNLYASVTTNGSNCGHCQSCAKIYQGTSEIRHAESHCGDENPCTGENDNFTLTAGVTYKLCVCLIPCPSETHQCTTCSQGFGATACVTATFGGGGCN